MRSRGRGEGEEEGGERKRDGERGGGGRVRDTFTNDLWLHNIYFYSYITRYIAHK